MSSKQSIWYHVGYALERARAAPSEGKRRLGSFRERSAEKSGHAAGTTTGSTGADDLVATGIVVLVTRALEKWRPRTRTGVAGLVKAGAAGAVAALLLELVRPLLRGEARLATFDEHTTDRLLAGAGQGLVYGAVVEPRLPGPSLLKGTLYGSAEYAVHPMGGLYRMLGSHAPLRRIPGLGTMLGDLDPDDRAYLEHVTFGIALSILYGVGSSPRSNGIVVDEDE